MGRKTLSLEVSGAIDWAGVKTHRLDCKSGEIVFSQGDPADTVFYIEYGVVRLSVLSDTGKEGVVAVLEGGDFFGETCLAGESKRVRTAITMIPTTLVAIAPEELIRLLHTSPVFSDRFLAYMLKRNLRIERDLTDQLFNNSEKRLARTLLLLSQYGSGATPRRIPRVSQEILAEMIGSTRGRVNIFMNRFRQLGLIDYKGNSDVTVNPALVDVILRH